MSERAYKDLLAFDDPFDMAEPCLSAAIALFGITSFTRKGALIVFAAMLAALGFTFGLSGLFHGNIHPVWLPKLLG